MASSASPAEGVRYIFYGFGEPDEEVPLQGGETAWVLDLSPFGVKLRAYLLMAGFKEGVDYEWKNMGDPAAAQGYGQMKKLNGKVPFVYLVKEDRYMGDSHLIIQMVEASKPPQQRIDGFLSPADKAVARGLQVLCEDSIYWSLIVNERWQQDENFWNRLALLYPFNRLVPYRFLTPMVLRGARNIVLAETAGHGMGRHSQEEQVAFAVDDLGHLSAFLAEKEFMFGNKPCLLDLTVYGLLVNVLVDAYAFKAQTSMASQQLLSMLNLLNFVRRVSKLLKEKRPTPYTRPAPYPLPLPKWEG